MTSKRNEREQLRRARKEKRSRALELSRANAGQQDIHKRILIVGEGVNTEPSYFDKFRVPGVKVVAKGLGEGTRKLVNDVEGVREDEERKQGVPFDEIWVAFDKDSFKDFEQAIREANDKGYQVAYSNQAIEYWFILHFKDHQGSAMPRTEYAKALNELLKPYGISYDPDAKEITEELFDVLLKNIQAAFDRACRIYANKCGRGCPTEESVTTIFQLVHAITGIITTEEKRVLAQKELSMKKAGVVKKGRGKLEL